MMSFLEHFRNREAELIRNILSLVEIESPSRDVAGNLQVVAWLEAQARAISSEFAIERVPAEGYGEHLLLRAFRSAQKPILLLGHTDTVHPRGSAALNPARVEDGKLYGCGVFDMKSGCVLMLEALRAFAELGLKPQRPIVMLLTCDEEIGSIKGRALIEREARDAEYSLVCEPSAAGRVKTGRKGTGMFELKAHGIPAHAGLEPEKGASAILEIARQIEVLHGWNDFAKGTTVTVCTIAGGSATNVVSAQATCSIDVRFTTMQEARRIESLLKNLAPFDERVRLELSGSINRPPLERTPEVVALYHHARELASSFDYELGEAQVGGASDGNFVAALGVPVLDGLGVSGDGAHTLNEFIYINDIVPRATLLALLLASLCEC